jgi:hypothetical protein
MMRSAIRRSLVLIVRFVCLVAMVLWVPVYLVWMGLELHLLPGELRLKRQMRAGGRHLSSAQLRRTTPAGTLILDSPTFSWAVSRLWYTPDDVLALAPVPYPSDDDRSEAFDRYEWHSFDRWCYNHYLCPKSGCAHLIGVWHSRRLAERLGNRLELPVVYSFSGGQWLEQLRQHEEDVEGNGASDGAIDSD